VKQTNLTCLCSC